MSPTTQPSDPTYTEKGDKNVNHRSDNKLKFSDFTSVIEGPDLGELRQLWRDIAASETRLNLMTELKGKKLSKRIEH